MPQSSRRFFAKVFLRTFHLSRLVLDLYPVAIENSFSTLTRQRIGELRSYLPLNISREVKWVRYGSDGDGGYLMNDDVLITDICLSLGVGDNYSFDLDIADRCKEVWMFDHTVDNPLVSKSNIKFKKIGISDISSNDFTTIDEILEDVPVANDLILKIDIEGSEWKVLGNLSIGVLSRFRQVIAEFHNLHAIADDVLFSDVSAALQKLNRTHELVNVHVNNWAKFHIVGGVPLPDVIEVTYLRRDPDSSRSSHFFAVENIEDMPNNSDAADFALNFICFLEVI